MNTVNRVLFHKFDEEVAQGHNAGYRHSVVHGDPNARVFNVAIDVGDIEL